MIIRARMEYVPIPAAGERAAQQAVPRMSRLGRRIEANAKQRAPVRSGNLRRTIGHRVTLDRAKVRLDNYATAGYARFMHDGTRPHVIRPRAAKALRFEMGGRVVFARRVNHPGTVARPFLANAVTEELARANLR